MQHRHGSATAVALLRVISNSAEAREADLLDPGSTTANYLLQQYTPCD